MAPKDFFFESTIAQADPYLSHLTAVEAERQMRKLILIASESLCPAPVREALASEFVNLYAEGYPSTRMSKTERDRIEDSARGLSYFRRYGDKRYYKGTEICNIIESLAEIRIAEVFASDRVPASEIFANVQPLSGAAANNAVYEAFVEPGTTVMGMALPHGGHLTHGSEFNRSGKTYRIVPYTVDPKTGNLDYDRIMDLAREHKPGMIIVGFSAYPWSVDWATFREIADAAGAVLFADIAHTAGLVAGGVYPNPVGWADVVTFTTHKTMCGPRGAVAITTDPDRARAVDNAVFPGEQGGPHLHSIAAKAVAFHLAATDEFRELQRGVVENAAALAKGFMDRGIPLAYGGTDTHLLLVDCKKIKTATGVPLQADVVSRILDVAGITLNKNTIAGDEKAAQPSGLRFGTTIVTQRGLGPLDMDRLAEVVTKLLTSLKSFDVQGQACRLGRAKVDADIFMETRAAVAELDAKGASVAVQRIGKYPYYVAVPHPSGDAPSSTLASAHEKAGADVKEIAGRRGVLHFGDPDSEAKAASEKCALIDGSEMAVFLVRGERAPAFLHAVTAGNVLGLEPLEGTRSFLIDVEGRVMDTVALLRVPDGPFQEPRFLLSTGPESAERAAEWLRALSDGYLEIGAGDLFAKVEGPVVIEEGEWASLTLAGPETTAVLEGASVKIPREGTAVKAALGGRTALALNPGDGLVELFVPSGGAAAVWEALKEGGAVPSGRAAREAVSRAKGYPSGGADAPEVAQAAGAAPPRALFPEKTFIVGSGRASTLPEAEALPPFRYSEEELPLRRTPLFEEHLKLTKKRNVVPFAGWEMPVVYTSISEEHAAVRERAGLFDVGHMGVFEVSGPRAARFLDLATTNYVPKLAVGESMYAYLLDPAGACIDDLMIYRVEGERFLVVVNAANAEKDWAWLSAYNAGKHLIDPARPGARVETAAVLRDLKDPSSGGDMKIDLAFQGPLSKSILIDLASRAAHGETIRRLARNRNTPAVLGGIETIVSRTGYTGEEFGYEIYVHPKKAVALWNLILEAGRSSGVQPTGLGARDSTRTEAGLPLYGHELEGPFGVDPVEAGYEYFVKWHKPFFAGRQGLLDKMEKRKREVVRFRARGLGARMAHLGDPVVSRNGKTVGRVTSSALSSEEQIGMALLDKSAARVGAPISIYCIPSSGKSPAEGPKAELKPGDRVLLPLEGRIISRFPEVE
ncbi:MAG: glycine cleavage system aminomethyltransferase GcvT [Planctomycetota bacterium]|jgi:glycine cleavage system T protein